MKASQLHFPADVKILLKYSENSENAENIENIFPTVNECEEYEHPEQLAKLPYVFPRKHRKLKIAPSKWSKKSRALYNIINILTLIIHRLKMCCELLYNKCNVYSVFGTFCTIFVVVLCGTACMLQQ